MLRKSKLNTSVLIALASLTATSAWAQQQLDRVEVTGSAIKRLDAETAVPVTVVKMEDLKKQGITTVEQVMSNLSAVQMQTGTSQSVGTDSSGAAFANLRGIGANKTLVLLNGRRIANNALDSSAPDLNAIPFAAIQRVEVLRDGASALYGTDAIGGVINFITRKDFTGGVITVGADSPQHAGGKSESMNIGYGYGDLEKNGFNLFGFVDYKKQNSIGGTQRPFNQRLDGGISSSTSPANYYQDGAMGNPVGGNCSSVANLIANGETACYITTSPYVDYIPKTERVSTMLKGTLKLNANNELGLEYFASRSKTTTQIAPTPYGALKQNRVLADGSLNPYYPGNPGSSITTPNITLDPNYGEGTTLADGVNPGYITVKWRDLVSGPRHSIGLNNQQRFVASLDGTAGAWDYQFGASYNENRVKSSISGYSDGTIISEGVLNGVINPFGEQSAAGLALIQSAAVSGVLQTAKGTVETIDARGSRELGDWLGAGRAAAIAVGAEFRHEKFVNKANAEVAEKVVSSTGIDPATNNVGSRTVSAAYTELNVPINKMLDVTAAVRYDKYNDFGSTTNPKFGFRFQPSKALLMRGSYSTGFRAPSLYEINAAQTYTNTSTLNDPVNCPGGVLAPGKISAESCKAQFQALYGGNKNLKPEKSKNATMGFVFEPMKDLNFALDFWWIQLRQQIDSLSDATVFADGEKYASLFHRNSQGNLSTDGSACPDITTCGYVDLRTQNLGGVNTNGVDISANYALRAGQMGKFTAGLQSTYVQSYKYQTEEGGEWIQNVGVYSGNGPVFRWQHNANLGWTRGDYAAGLSAHYKSGYLDQDPSNRVNSYTTFDIYGAWAATQAISLTFGVKNLFDRDPPMSNQEAVFQAGYDPRYTDPTGRTYYARASYKF
jgi:iron complex outermembrane recepter protein